MSQVDFNQQPFGDATFADNPENRCAVVLVLDTSGSMAGQRIQELNAGLQTFRDELFADSLASKRVEVAIVTFGPVKVECDFTGNSELCLSWNPRGGADPVDAFFRQGAMPANAVCVMANWRDNQWFNKTMDAERLECLNNQPEQYDHIWEGDYQKIVAGAYYAA